MPDGPEYAVPALEKGLDIIELGCGWAKLARTLLERHPGSRATDLEVDERQHAKNIAAPQQGLTFAIGRAQAIPFPAASFDLVPLLAQALGEAVRVCRCSSRVSPTSSSA